MTDIDLARRANLKPITELVQEKMNLDSPNLELYGHYKAKLPLAVLDSLKFTHARLTQSSASLAD